MHPMDVPKVGRLAVLSDPQGATFGIIKPEPAS
jgi:predicted enzyme related to lactoylglutathione lyase